ncbi:MAG: hypothetical protein K2G88_06470 [Oscillospiraceae bacterium]|nr:hypothetical protein [Oscillospiraceae bacterium]
MLETEKNKLVTVQLIDRKWANHVNKEQIIGYCNYKLHRGALTEQLLKSHECIQKKCPYLKRLEDRKFWIKRKDRTEHKKAMKLEKHMQEEFSKNLLIEAQEFAENYQAKLDIIQVNFDKSKNYYIIFYISDNSDDDYNEYLDFLYAYQDKKQAKAELRHIRDMNGNYVTRAEKCYHK